LLPYQCWKREISPETANRRAFLLWDSPHWHPTNVKINKARLYICNPLQHPVEACEILVDRGCFYISLGVGTCGTCCCREAPAYTGISPCVPLFSE
jgi:hypothetical protein